MNERVTSLAENIENNVLCRSISRRVGGGASLRAATHHPTAFDGLRRVKMRLHPSYKAYSRQCLIHSRVLPLSLPLRRQGLTRMVCRRDRDRRQKACSRTVSRRIGCHLPENIPLTIGLFPAQMSSSLYGLVK